FFVYGCSLGVTAIYFSSTTPLCHVLQSRDLQETSSIYYSAQQFRLPSQILKLSSYHIVPFIN
ncbi:MAG: hypothetical protein ACR2PH_06860, partial [Desulfobulbia bacterium]